MSSNIKLFPYNLLAEPETIVTVTGSDTGFPASRLYDRYLSLIWKYTANVAITFEVDQGTPDTELGIDTLIIDQHNFGEGAGRTMDWQYSDGDSTYTDAITQWTQDDNSQIVKTLDSIITERYWQVLVNSAVLNPYCGEIYMSRGYEFNVDVNSPPQIYDMSNVQWNRSIGGMERSTVYGEEIRGRVYTLNLEGDTQLDNFRTCMAYLDNYGKPLYIMDHDGDYWIAKIATNKIEEQWISDNLTRVELSLSEIL